MFLYMQDNVLRRAGKCCATVREMFLCGEDFDSEDGFIDFSKLTLFIGDRELEKLPSQNYSLYAVGLKRLFFVVIMMSYSQAELQSYFSTRFRT